MAAASLGVAGSAPGGGGFGHMHQGRFATRAAGSKRAVAAGIPSHEPVCLASVLWPDAKAGGQTVTCSAVDQEFRAVATGTLSGCVYLWHVVKNSRHGNKRSRRREDIDTDQDEEGEVRKFAEGSYRGLESLTAVAGAGGIFGGADNSGKGAGSRRRKVSARSQMGEMPLAGLVPYIALLPEWGAGSAVQDLAFTAPPSPSVQSCSSLTLMSLHSDGTIRQWSLDDGRCLQVFKPFALVPFEVHFLRVFIDNRFVAFGGLRALRIIDSWSWRQVIALRLPSSFAPSSNTSTAFAAPHPPAATSVTACVPTLPAGCDPSLAIVSAATNVPAGYRSAAELNAWHSCSVGAEHLIATTFSNGVIACWDVTADIAKVRSIFPFAAAASPSHDLIWSNSLLTSPDSPSVQIGRRRSSQRARSGGRQPSPRRSSGRRGISAAPAARQASIKGAQSSETGENGDGSGGGVTAGILTRLGLRSAHTGLRAGYESGAAVMRGSEDSASSDGRTGGSVPESGLSQKPTTQQGPYGGAVQLLEESSHPAAGTGGESASNPSGVTPRGSLAKGGSVDWKVKKGALIAAFPKFISAEQTLTDDITTTVQSSANSVGQQSGKTFIDADLGLHIGGGGGGGLSDAMVVEGDFVFCISARGLRIITLRRLPDVPLSAEASSPVNDARSRRSSGSSAAATSSSSSAPQRAAAPAARPTARTGAISKPDADLLKTAESTYHSFHDFACMRVPSPLDVANAPHLEAPSNTSSSRKTSSGSVSVAGAARKYSAVLRQKHESPEWLGVRVLHGVPLSAWREWVRLTGNHPWLSSRPPARRTPQPRVSGRSDRAASPSPEQQGTPSPPEGKISTLLAWTADGALFGAPVGHPVAMENGDILSAARPLQPSPSFRRRGLGTTVSSVEGAGVSSFASPPEIALTQSWAKSPKLHFLGHIPKCLLSDVSCPITFLLAPSVDASGRPFHELLICGISPDNLERLHVVSPIRFPRAAQPQTIPISQTTPETNKSTLSVPTAAGALPYSPSTPTSSPGRGGSFNIQLAAASEGAALQVPAPSLFTSVSLADVWRLPRSDRNHVSEFFQAQIRGRQRSGVRHAHFHSQSPSPMQASPRTPSEALPKNAFRRTASAIAETADGHMYVVTTYKSGQIAAACINNTNPSHTVSKKASQLPPVPTASSSRSSAQNSSPSNTLDGCVTSGAGRPAVTFTRRLPAISAVKEVTGELPRQEVEHHHRQQTATNNSNDSNGDSFKRILWTKVPVTAPPDAKQGSIAPPAGSSLTTPPRSARMMRIRVVRRRRPVDGHITTRPAIATRDAESQEATTSTSQRRPFAGATVAFGERPDSSSAIAAGALPPRISNASPACVIQHSRVACAAEGAIQRPRLPPEVKCLVALADGVVVGGTAAGDVAWWRLPQLALLGYLPRVLPDAIVRILKILPFGMRNGPSFEGERFVAFDSTGAFCLIDTHPSCRECFPRAEHCKILNTLNATSYNAPGTSSLGADQGSGVPSVPPAPRGSRSLSASRPADASRLSAAWHRSSSNTSVGRAVPVSSSKYRAWMRHQWTTSLSRTWGASAGCDPSRDDPMAVPDSMADDYGGLPSEPGRLGHAVIRFSRHPMLQPGAVRRVVSDSKADALVLVGNDDIAYVWSLSTGKFLRRISIRRFLVSDHDASSRAAGGVGVSGGGTMPPFNPRNPSGSSEIPASASTSAAATAVAFRTRGLHSPWAVASAVTGTRQGRVLQQLGAISGSASGTSWAGAGGAVNALTSVAALDEEYNAFGHSVIDNENEVTAQQYIEMSELGFATGGLQLAGSAAIDCFQSLPVLMLPVGFFMKIFNAMMMGSFMKAVGPPVPGAAIESVRSSAAREGQSGKEGGVGPSRVPSPTSGSSIGRGDGGREIVHTAARRHALACLPLFSLFFPREISEDVSSLAKRFFPFLSASPLPFSMAVVGAASCLSVPMPPAVLQMEGERTAALVRRRGHAAASVLIAEFMPSEYRKEKDRRARTDSASTISPASLRVAGGSNSLGVTSEARAQLSRNLSPTNSSPSTGGTPRPEAKSPPLQNPVPPKLEKVPEEVSGVPTVAAGPSCDDVGAARGRAAAAIALMQSRAMAELRGRGLERASKWGCRRILLDVSPMCRVRASVMGFAVGEAARNAGLSRATPASHIRSMRLCLRPFNKTKKSRLSRASSQQQAAAAEAEVAASNGATGDGTACVKSEHVLQGQSTDRRLTFNALWIQDEVEDDRDGEDVAFAKTFERPFAAHLDTVDFDDEAFGGLPRFGDLSDARQLARVRRQAMTQKQLYETLSSSSDHSGGAGHRPPSGERPGPLERFRDASFRSDSSRRLKPSPTVPLFFPQTADEVGGDDDLLVGNAITSRQRVLRSDSSTGSATAVHSFSRAASAGGITDDFRRTESCSVPRSESYYLFPPVPNLNSPSNNFLREPATSGSGELGGPTKLPFGDLVAEATRLATGSQRERLASGSQRERLPTDSSIGLQKFPSIGSTSSISGARASGQTPRDGSASRRRLSTHSRSVAGETSAAQDSLLLDGIGRALVISRQGTDSSRRAATPRTPPAAETETLDIGFTSDQQDVSPAMQTSQSVTSGRIPTTQVEETGLTETGKEPHGGLPIDDDDEDDHDNQADNSSGSGSEFEEADRRVAADDDEDDEETSSLARALKAGNFDHQPDRAEVFETALLTATTTKSGRRQRAGKGADGVASGSGSGTLQAFWPVEVFPVDAVPWEGGLCFWPSAYVAAATLAMLDVAISAVWFHPSCPHMKARLAERKNAVKDKIITGILLQLPGKYACFTLLGHLALQPAFPQLRTAGKNVLRRTVKIVDIEYLQDLTEAYEIILESANGEEMRRSPTGTVSHAAAGSGGAEKVTTRSGSPGILLWNDEHGSQQARGGSPHSICKPEVFSASTTVQKTAIDNLATVVLAIVTIDRNSDAGRKQMISRGMIVRKLLLALGGGSAPLPNRPSSIVVATGGTGAATTPGTAAVAAAAGGGGLGGGGSVTYMSEDVTLRLMLFCQLLHAGYRGSWRQEMLTGRGISAILRRQMTEADLELVQGGFEDLVNNPKLQQDNSANEQQRKAYVPIAKKAPLYELIFRTFELSLHPKLLTAATGLLWEVGRVDPELLITAMGLSARRLENGPKYSNAALMVLVSFINRFPLQVIEHIPDLTEAIIRCLDPSDPTLRRSTLNGATSALFQLVKIFPMVTFHQSTQRFAIGTQDAYVVIYDLRTATKWRVLEGHTGPISALGFSEDGGQLGSYSVRDRTFRLWQCSGTGFFGGILALSGKCQKMVCLPVTPGSPNTEKTGSYAARVELLRDIAVHYRSKSEWILKREDGKGYMVIV